MLSKENLPADGWWRRRNGLHGRLTVSSTDGQEGGPDISCYYRPWQLGFSAQAGYGSAHQYGQLTMYKELDITEPFGLPHP